jgi:hypothetical protein
MVEIPTSLISTLCMLCGCLALPLTLIGVLPYRIFVPAVVVGLTVLLVLRRIKSLLLRARLSSRSDSLLKAFDNLPKKYVAIENGNTYRKIKFVTEDEGVCLLDAKKRRLLIEACSYRYIIYAQDVRSVEPVSTYGGSGALLDCTMAGYDIKFMLGVAGQGPIASMTDAFNPASAARDLATTLKNTLFATQPPPV